MTAVTVPDGITGDDVVRATQRRGFTLGSGYGAVKARTFRVGHMGDHTPDRLAACLEATEDALAELLGR